MISGCIPAHHMATLMRLDHVALQWIRFHNRSHYYVASRASKITMLTVLLPNRVSFTTFTFLGLSTEGYLRFEGTVGRMHLRERKDRDEIQLAESYAEGLILSPHSLITDRSI